MLASYPASILNHIPPRSGIPFDSFKTGNALAQDVLKPIQPNNLSSKPIPVVSTGA